MQIEDNYGRDHQRQTNKSGMKRSSWMMMQKGGSKQEEMEQNSGGAILDAYNRHQFLSRNRRLLPKKQMQKVAAEIYFPTTPLAALDSDVLLFSLFWSLYKAIQTSQIRTNQASKM